MTKLAIHTRPVAMSAYRFTGTQKSADEIVAACTARGVKSVAGTRYDRETGKTVVTVAVRISDGSDGFVCDVPIGGYVVEHPRESKAWEPKFMVWQAKAFRAAYVIEKGK